MILLIIECRENGGGRCRLEGKEERRGRWGSIAAETEGEDAGWGDIIWPRQQRCLIRPRQQRCGRWWGLPLGRARLGVSGSKGTRAGWTRVRDAPSADAACRVGCSTLADALVACTAQHNFSPVQTRMHSIAHRRTLATRQTPCPRGGAICSARARLGRAIQYSDTRLYYDVCHSVSRPGRVLSRTSHCHTSRAAANAKRIRQPTFPHRTLCCCGSLVKSANRNLPCLRSPLLRRNW